MAKKGRASNFVDAIFKPIGKIITDIGPVNILLATAAAVIAYELLHGAGAGVDAAKKAFGPSPGAPGTNKSSPGGPTTNTTVQAPADTTNMKPLVTSNLPAPLSTYQDIAESLYAKLDTVGSMDNEGIIELMQGHNDDELKQIYIDFGQRASTIGTTVLRNFALGDKHDLIYWLQNYVDSDDQDTLRTIWLGTGLWPDASVQIFKDIVKQVVPGDPFTDNTGADETNARPGTTDVESDPTLGPVNPGSDVEYNTGP